MTKKRGRPSWVPPDLKKVEELAERGLTNEQIALCLGIHVGTLYAKKNEFHDFDEAIKKGHSKGISIISNALFESAKNGNTTAQIFFLKCRANWKETNTDVNVNLIKQEDAIKELE